MGVFAKGEGVMSAGQGGLQVAKDDVQPLECVHLAAGLAFVLHERPRDHRRLLPARLTLQVAQRSSDKFIGVIAATGREAVSVWPTATHQRCLTLRFRSVVDNESGQGHSLLKLDTVDRHDFALCEGASQPTYSMTNSWGEPV